jgi:CubicO group peptidase (beta-lactamase class C family)
MKQFKSRPVYLRILAVGALAASFAAPMRPQENPPDSAALNAKVDAIFAAYDKPHSPGCELGVIRNGQLIYTRGYGLANLEYDIPISSHTVFYVGSVSKQFTAMNILLLAQQGKLSLDDPVRKYIPELPEYSHPIAVAELIHHTSGLRDYYGLMSLAGIDTDGVLTEDQALWFITHQKHLNFDPGDEYLYSNSGYFLEGIIVKRVTGKSLAEFARENIFEPLGMNNTHYHNDHTMIVPQRASGYAPKSGGNGFRLSTSYSELIGAGGVMTTIEDLLLWDQNFYSGKVGGVDLLRQMTKTATLNSGEKLTYASGLEVDSYRGLPRVSHGGAFAGYRAELMRFPEQHFSVGCLCNLATTNPTQLATRVADAYLAGDFKTPAADRLKAAPVQLSESELNDKVGLYRDSHTGGLWKISVRDSQLRMGEGNDAFELVPIDATHFRAAPFGDATPIVFDTLPGGKPRLQIEFAGSKPEVYESVQAVSPAKPQLSAYAGDYYSAEIEATWHIAVDGDKLTAQINHAPPVPLAPAFRDAFFGPVGPMEFSRDAYGRVTGFAVRGGRVRNFRFAKK